MSLHLDAPEGSYAEIALLPGDPLRARFIAEHWLKDAIQVNARRGMHGFTGLYKGRRVSVQATGMGMPSASIYIHELIRDYGVRTLIRVGTCGSLRSDLGIGELLMASAASTDSGINRNTFGGLDFAPAADFGLLKECWDVSAERGLRLRVGGVLSSDRFYASEEVWRIWAEYGVLGVEMETSALYTLAARNQVRALALLTVSDEIFTGAQMPPEDRERKLHAMVELALEAGLRA